MIKMKNQFIKNLVLFKLLIIIEFFVQVFSFNIFQFVKFQLSIITLKINGTGEKNVFSYIYPQQYYPKEVYINGNNQTKIKFNYSFDESNNTVELLWYDDVKYFERMFLGCFDIIEIDLSKAKSSRVNSTILMFSYCRSLKLINLTNFDTSNVIRMDDMFAGCSSLISLDLTNFDTSKVIFMDHMFAGCSSLISLDLSSLDTSQTRYMRYLFSGCTSLTYLNISNFDISQVIEMDRIFNGCERLEYINLSNLNNIFYILDKIIDTIPGNVAIYINENSFPENSSKQINEINCYNILCLDENKSEKIKMIISANKNNITHEYKYGYNGKCYNNDLNGYLNIENDTCQCNSDECLNCLKINSTKDLCNKCLGNYFPKEYDSSNIRENITCHKNPKGYYLDKIDLLYKKCYDTCETCEIKGNETYHICLMCNSDYTFEINKNNYLNCYENCSNYYYFDDDNNFHCTDNRTCPEEYPKLIKNKNECIKHNFIDKIKNGLKNETKKSEDENKYYNTILKNIEDALTSEDFDTYDLDNGEEEIIEEGKISITITTTQNLRNTLKDNITSINLDNCEHLLRSSYNISDDKLLYMKKIDVEQEEMNIPKIEYDIYCKLNDTKLIKLNLTACENTSIFLTIPMELKDNPDIFNSSSGYYNDICYKAKSEDGTDISAKDRANEMIKGNKAVCQDDCYFYDYNQKKVNCSCKVKKASYNIEDMNINKTILYKDFENIENKKDIANLAITSCNVLDSKENIEKNTGFFLLLIILILFIIVFIIFCIKGYNLLEDKMDEIIYKKFEKPKKIERKKSKTIKSIINERPNNENKNNKRKSLNIATTKKMKHSTNSVFKENRTKKTKKKKKKNSILNLNIETNGPKIKNDLPNNNSNKPDTDYELNWLSYNLALIYDKRSGCEYYCSLIRTKQLFIFTFCSFNDYNSGIIKKFMFFLSFALHYTINALFFTTTNLHQIYEDKGKFNFEYQTPHIIISAIVSTLILRLMLQFLVLTDKDILQVKLQETKDKAINMKKIKLKNMKIKFAIFFILNFILLGLFWYYLTCFNAIYENTQIYLIENTFISFGFSLFYPFIINILPTLFRTCSLDTSNKDKECIYNFSKIIQII